MEINTMEALFYLKSKGRKFQALMVMLISCLVGIFYSQNSKKQWNKEFYSCLEYRNAPCVANALKHGADPNASDGTVTSTLWERLGKLLHLPIHKSPALPPPLITAVRVAVFYEDGEHVGLGDDEAQEEQKVTKLARLLLQNGVPVDSQDDDGKTPLMWAAFAGRVALMKLLLEHGASMNIQDKEGKTALHLAVWEKQTQAVELLLQHKADTRLKDKYGCTPLRSASFMYHYPANIIALLKQSGAK